MTKRWSTAFCNKISRRLCCGSPSFYNATRVDGNLEALIRMVSAIGPLSIQCEGHNYLHQKTTIIMTE